MAQFTESTKLLVKFERLDGKLGFSFQGGADMGCAPHVTEVVPGGAAARVCCVQLEDIIEEVNGVRTHGLTHNEILELMLLDHRTIELLLRRNYVVGGRSENQEGSGNPTVKGISGAGNISARTESTASSVESFPASSIAESLERRVGGGVGVGCNSPFSTSFPSRLESFAPVQPANGVVLRVAFARVDGKLGFSFSGGIDEQHAPLVTEIFPGGAADRDGRLKVGDVVEEVNGNTVEQLTHAEIAKLMCAGLSGIRLAIRRSEATSMGSSIGKSLNPGDQRVGQSQVTRRFSANLVESVSAILATIPGPHEVNRQVSACRTFAIPRVPL